MAGRLHSPPNRIPAVRAGIGPFPIRAMGRRQPRTLRSVRRRRLRLEPEPRRLRENAAPRAPQTNRRRKLYRFASSLRAMRALRTVPKLDLARERESDPSRLYEVEGAKGAEKRRSEDGTPSSSERRRDLAGTKSRSANGKSRSANWKSSSANWKSSSASSPTRSCGRPRRSDASRRRSANSKRRFASRPGCFATSTRCSANLKSRSATCKTLGPFATALCRLQKTLGQSSASLGNVAKSLGKVSASLGDFDNVARRMSPRRSATLKRRSAKSPRRSATSKRRSAKPPRRSARAEGDLHRIRRVRRGRQRAGAPPRRVTAPVRGVTTVLQCACRSFSPWVVRQGQAGARPAPGGSRRGHAAAGGGTLRTRPRRRNVHASVMARDVRSPIADDTRRPVARLSRLALPAGKAGGHRRRQISRRAGPRRRRDGGGRGGDAPAARRAGRAQIPARAGGSGPRNARALHAGSEGGGKAQERIRGACSGLRRHRRRDALHRHGVSPGAGSGRRDPKPRSPRRAERRRIHDPGVRGARRGPRPGDRAPRHQAGEPVSGRSRPGVAVDQDPRLRHIEVRSRAGGGRLEHLDAEHHGVALLHVARAASFDGLGGSSDRHLVARGNALRGPLWQDGL